MPPLSRHHERALALVGLRSLHLGDFGKLGLDGAALVVDGFQVLRQAACLVIRIGKQQVKRQLRVTHTPGGIQARNEREA